MVPEVTNVMFIFDIALAASLLWLAWQLLGTEDIFKAVVLYIAFGLMMALTWVRLQAPDVALAEAAIGAGLTGPMFLGALRRMKRIKKDERRLTIKRMTVDTIRGDNRQRKRLNPVTLPVIILIAALTTLLAALFISIPSPPSILLHEVFAYLKESGASSPVTAVLLDFRGYDTLLEVMVFFMAVTGVWSLTKAFFPDHLKEISPVQYGLVRMLIPLMFLIAAYLVWQGSSFVGGAFQGGAVLAGALVLLLITDLPGLQTMQERLLRFGLILGPVVFLGIAVFCLFTEGKFLDYPVNAARVYLLLIESACAVSIGLTLAGLFAGGRPHDREKPVQSADLLKGEGKAP